MDIDTQPVFTMFTISYNQLDGSNECYDVKITNDLDWTGEQIITLLTDDIGLDGVIAKQWGLPNPAPVDSENIAAGKNEHAYCTISDIVHYTQDTNVTSIATHPLSDLKAAVDNGGVDAFFEQEKAIKQRHLKGLIADLEANFNDLSSDLLEAEDRERMTSIATRWLA